MNIVDEKQWLDEYFGRYRQSILENDVREQLIELKRVLMEMQMNGRKVMIAGNGGSAAIASHCAVDFTKNARIRCITFSDVGLVTCFSNDYGYEKWLEKALEFYADDGDVSILISSSGKSHNMVKAAEYAIRRKLKLVTFTGFAVDNPLRALGSLNFWVNSYAYNVVEMTHHIWLLAVCDLIIGAAEYPASQ